MKTLTDEQIEIIRSIKNADDIYCPLSGNSCLKCPFSRSMFKDYFGINCGMKEEIKKFCINYFKKQLELDFGVI